MALKNPNLKKVGNAVSAPYASGHTQMQLVQPAVALPDPGTRDPKDPTWPQRYQQYLESVAITQKFSGDAE